MSYNWYDFAGNIGVLLIILSYLLLQTGKLEGRSLKYSLANAAGASLILISLINDFNLSAFVIEIFWLAISIFGIFNNRKTGAAV